MDVVAFKNPYTDVAFAVSVSEHEDCFYAGQVNVADLHGFDRQFCRKLGWEETTVKEMNRHWMKGKKMADVDKQLLEECVKRINEANFWIKEMDQKKHQWTILNKKTGSTFDVSIRDFCATASPEKALEYVETQNAIFTVVESGK